MAEAPPDPLTVVERWYDRAWTECDLSVVDELVADRLLRHGLTGTTTRTRDEVKSDLRQYQRALGKPVITVRDQVLDGDRVWTRVTMRGVSMETGEHRTVERISIHRVDAGRIVEVWTLHAHDVVWEDAPSRSGSGSTSTR